MNSIDEDCSWFSLEHLHDILHTMHFKLEIDDDVFIPSDGEPFYITMTRDGDENGGFHINNKYGHMMYSTNKICELCSNTKICNLHVTWTIKGNLLKCLNTRFIHSHLTAHGMKTILLNDYFSYLQWNVDPSSFKPGRIDNDRIYRLTAIIELTKNLFKGG